MRVGVLVQLVVHLNHESAKSQMSQMPRKNQNTTTQLCYMYIISRMLVRAGTELSLRKSKDGRVS